ncbi:MAG: hypothetical protein ACRBEE_11825 [Arenicella sp.]
MNIPILIAAALCFIAFFAHAFVGDKEFKQLKPLSDSEDKIRETWVQTRSGWHWVSVDLLLSGVLLVMIAVSDVIQAKQEVLVLLSVYYAMTGFVWISTVFFSRNHNKQLLVLGQWMFCFLVSVLIYYGSLSHV